MKTVQIEQYTHYIGTNYMYAFYDDMILVFTLNTMNPEEGRWVASITHWPLGRWLFNDIDKSKKSPEVAVTKKDVLKYFKGEENLLLRLQIKGYIAAREVLCLLKKED